MSHKSLAYAYGLLIWLVLIAAIHFTLPFTPISYWHRLPSAWQWFVELNLATFLLFGLDKVSAQIRIRRIPEMILYVATLFGGSVGALAAMNVLRHKTRKTGFQIMIALLILAQVLIVVYWL